ncbi:cGMP-dependent protein kinase 1-like isoform X1 [Petromyzon marinus]|uniref:cGMP-dependent protein kinase 1-like isoform X1 n=1 Tax=Petromyzon marinus TaxID=7757 RepID=UPI003F71A464
MTVEMGCFRSVRDLELRLLTATNELEKEREQRQELETRLQYLEQQLRKKEAEVAQLKSERSLEAAARKSCEVAGCDRGGHGRPIMREPLPDSCFLLAKRVPKSPSTARLVEQAVRSNELLKRMQPGQTVLLGDCMSETTRARGETIIAEGDSGESMYILMEGLLDVSKQGESLCTLQPGALFGELAILYDCTRTATVKALTDVRLLYLSRHAFRSVLMRESQLRRKLIIKFLKTAKTLKNLPDEQLSKMFDCMEESAFADGEAIVNEGEVGHIFYVILRGQVRVSQEVEGSPRLIRVLEPGDHFGELALIRNMRRTATCTAVGAVTCLTLHSEVFTETIPLEQIEFPTELDCFTQPAVANSVATVSRERLVASDTEEEEAAAAVCCLSHLQPVRYADTDEPVTLGVGAFGRVDMVCCGSTVFALKKVGKANVVQLHQEEHVRAERHILADARSPFIVRLYRVFRDNKFVYFLLEMCEGGELWSKLRDAGKFDETTAVFCCACVVEAFDYLHTRGIIYRDLKPENLMLDRYGYIKLGDFGFAKKLPRGEKTYSFCGTPEYLAPEVLRNEGHDFGVDLWGLGILAYELLTGSPPFTSLDPNRIYSKILEGNVMYPLYVGDSARSFVHRMCRPRPGQRLGNGKNGLASVRNHSWFRNVDWRKLQSCQIEAPTARLIRKGSPYVNFDRLPRDSQEPPDELSGWDIDLCT